MTRRAIAECVIAVAIVIVLGIGLYLLLGEPTVDVSQITKVGICAENRETGKIVTEELKDEDADVVLKILSGKTKKSDSPGDLFSEGLAFILTDGDTQFYYCPATDGSCVIYSKNDEMYVTVSQEERNKINDLFEAYCGNVF